MAKRATLSGIAKTLKTPSRKKTVVEERMKVTLTMDAKMFANLERAVLKMKNLYTQRRGQINKSLLVELALANALEDLIKQGKDSQLYKDTETRITLNTDLF